MKSKPIVVICLGMLLLGFAAGRYTNRKAAVQTQSGNIARIKDDTVTDRRTVIVKEPNGTKTTTIVEETRTKSDQILLSREKESSAGNSPKINVSALAGFDFAAKSAVYGVSLTKEVFGPVTVGGFGLSNGTFGVSVGLNF